MEAAGKTVLPGLIDVHVHLGSPGGMYADPKEYMSADAMPRALAQYLYSGITAVKLRLTKRSGEVAILLERLTRRDGYAFEEACDLMQTNHQITMSRPELEAIAARLPHRLRRRFESEDALTHLAADQPSIDEIVADRERAVIGARLESALNKAMAALEAQDRLIFELRFRDGRTIAEIARALRLDQKALYRRVDRCLDALLAGLQAGGIDKAQAIEILRSSAVSVEWADGTGGTLRARPSMGQGGQTWS